VSQSPEAPGAPGLDELHASLLEADELDVDHRLELLRTVEARLSAALEGLDGL
jgi:hypothetical protein